MRLSAFSCNEKLPCFGGVCASAMDVPNILSTFLEPRRIVGVSPTAASPLGPHHDDCSSVDRVALDCRERLIGMVQIESSDLRTEFDFRG